MRRAGLWLLGVLLIAGCGGGSDRASSAATEAATSTTASTSTTSTSTTTTTSPEQLAAEQAASDKKLIVALWRRLSDVWGDGTALAAGRETYLATAYPGAFTEADFDSCFRGTKTYFEEDIVNQQTIERDDGWKVPGGGLDGVVPDGRIYIMSLHNTTTINGVPSVNDTESHVTIVDGVAYWFPGACTE